MPSATAVTAAARGGTLTCRQQRCWAVLASAGQLLALPEAAAAAHKVMYIGIPLTQDEAAQRVEYEMLEPTGQVAEMLECTALGPAIEYFASLVHYYR